MRICAGRISKEVLGLFSSDIGSDEFFSYVGNLVSLEHAVAVLGILSPDFIERDGHIFWHPNAQQYAPEKFPLLGIRKTKYGNLEESRNREDIERYRNNFSINQFFTRWEDSKIESALKVDLSEREYQLCYAFAHQIAKYWRCELIRCFPDRAFEFEIADNILDEYGVCVTFWQASC